MRNQYLRSILWIALAVQVARIMSVSSFDRETPFLSANDRSRWCTVAALVEDRSFAIDRVIEIRDRHGKRPWYSIDMVQHLGSDGTLHYYSSKPPLLSVLYACVYQVIYSATGMKITEQPFYVGRIILLVVNLVPLAILWWAFTRWIDRTVRGGWCQVTLMNVLVWGTFLTTFATTLNNHLPAAVAVGSSMLLWLKWSSNDSLRWWSVAMLGLLTSFGAACELPALSWVGMLALLILLRRGIPMVVVYALSTIPIAFAFFATNYAAHGEFQPAYAHRGLGPQIASYPKAPTEADQPTVEQARSQLVKDNMTVGPNAVIVPARFADAWSLWDDENNLRWTITSSGERWQVHQSGDWYDYPKSYWRDENRRGVDRGEKSRIVYTFHLLVGHHGIFSLTPFWIVACMGAWSLRRTTDQDEKILGLAICVTTLVCMVFYLMRPEIDRNYGGVSCTFRWLIWLTPAWLILSKPGLTWIRKRPWARRLTEASIAVSIFSAVYPWNNPWVHPWLFNWWSFLQWINYP